MLFLAISCAVAVPHIEGARVEHLNQAALDRLSGSWLAVEKNTTGQSTKDPEDLFGRSFDMNMLWVSWNRRGELSTSARTPFRLDATRTPMRLDFPNEAPQGSGRPPLRTVMPCIFKIEDGTLVIASGGWAEDKPLKPGEDYPGRPTDFTSTKQNGVTVVIFKPCGYLAQD